jgi:membrane associated rhomboid family serine protease
MGIYDRDYYRQPSVRGGFAEMRVWSVNTWLIVINVIVFLLDQSMNGALTILGYFSFTTAIIHLQLWRFITFQFLHANVQHIFFNMLSLYFFGPIVEAYLGTRRYLAFYLISGIGGGLGYIALYYLGFLQGDPRTPLVGASAGIFGVLIGAAQIAPDVRVMMMFPPIPMRLKTMAWVFIGIAIYTVYSNGNNAGGQAAHLGGALIGFILIRNTRWLDFVFLRRSGMFSNGRRVERKDWSNDFDR